MNSMHNRWGGTLDRDEVINDMVRQVLRLIEEVANLQREVRELKGGRRCPVYVAKIEHSTETATQYFNNEEEFWGYMKEKVKDFDLQIGYQTPEQLVDFGFLGIDGACYMVNLIGG